METPKVILVGGAPLSGKSSAARKLASALQYQCISTDDLGAAARMVTSPHSHPAFHFVGSNYQKYYVSQTIVQLIMDAEQYQEALWPALEHVIRSHAEWSSPAVIEGWTLQPERVAKLGLDNVRSVWLVSQEAVFERRLRADERFLAGAEDAHKLVRHFVRRSMWYDLYIRKIAPVYKLPVVEVQPEMTEEDVFAAVSEMIFQPQR